MSSWSTGYSFDMGQGVFVNDFLYVPNNYSGKIIKTSLDGTVIDANWCGGLTGPQCCVNYGDYLYVSTGSTITKILLSDPTIVNTSWAIGLSNAYGIDIYGTDLYVADINTNYISKISLLDPTVKDLTWGAANSPIGLAINGADLYVGNAANSIIKIPFASGIPDPDWIITSITLPRGLTVYGANLYVSNPGTSIVSKISILDKSVTDFLTGLSSPFGMVVYNSYIYISRNPGPSGGTIGKYPLPLWSTTGAEPSGSAIDSVNGYLYVINYRSDSITRITIATGESSIFTTSGDNLSFPSTIVIDSTHENLYITNNGGAGSLSRVVIATQVLSTILTGDVTNNFFQPLGMAIDATNTYLYVSRYSSNNTIQKVRISNGDITTLTITGDSFATPTGTVIDSTGTNLYVVNLGNNTISKVVIATQVASNFASGFSSPEFVAIDSTNDNLYVANKGNNTISQVVISTQAVSEYVPASFGLSAPSGVTIDSTDTYLYVNNSGNNTVSRINLPESDPGPGPTPPIVCFKEGSKILTDKGYVVIEDLRKGDLVKTVKHGFMPIDMIGKRDIVHPAFKERIKDQLYKCSQSEYPELFEPLVITGCHAILVDEFVSPEQREQTSEVLGRIFVTDKKYRLPACVDKRASVYEIKGECTIYHLALENEEYFANYGIYANGLLVETCSKRYLKELSNMTLIE